MKQKYVIPWSFILLAPVVSFSQVVPPAVFGPQIVNIGTLKIDPSTIAYFGNEYLNTGTHDNEGDLYLNHNFINDGTTSIPTSGTTFFSSAVNDTLTISGTTGKVNFYNLEVNVTGATKKGVSVVDSFDIEVVNKVNLVSGDLRLVGEAQLIQTHSGSNANTPGSGSLLKDQQGISSTYGYNYWSSPVANNSGFFTLQGGLFDGTDASINSFEPQHVSFNTGAPYNGVPAIVDGSNNVTTPLFISDRWLYTYSPSSLGYSGWDKINKDSQLAPGIGFIMKGTGASNQNYVFKGVPNDGEYTFSIQAGESMVIGNPYPSSIDSEKFITDNLGVINEIQFWVDGGSNSHYLANYLGGYSIRNKTGGVAPSVISSIAGVGSASGLIPKQYIAVGQGFFVDAFSTGPVIFKNSQRSFQTEDGSNSIFYKTSNTKGRITSEVDEPNRFIRIGYVDPEMFHRQLLLGFLPNSTATLDFNMGYDSVMLDPRDDEMFYIIENDLTRKYVIQGVGTYDVSYEFPIGLKISEVGTHTIMLDDIENFEDVIYIKDNVLNTSYNLSKSNFSLKLPPGDYLDRFSIVFDNSTSKSTLDNTDVFAENNLRVYYLNNKIVINNTNNLELSDVAIFNTVGQKIIELNKADLRQQKTIIPFRYEQGLYVVKVESGQHKKTFKIIN